MKVRVGTFEAKSNLSALMNQALNGDDVCIMRHGKPLVRLTPVNKDDEEPSPKFGCLKGQIKMENNFEDPLEDFDDYTQ